MKLREKEKFIFIEMAKSKKNSEKEGETSHYFQDQRQSPQAKESNLMILYRSQDQKLNN